MIIDGEMYAPEVNYSGIQRDKDDVWLVVCGAEAEAGVNGADTSNICCLTRPLSYCCRNGRVY